MYVCYPFGRIHVRDSTSHGFGVGAEDWLGMGMGLGREQCNVLRMCVILHEI